MNIDFPDVCSVSIRAVHISVGLGSTRLDSWLFPLLPGWWDSLGPGCRERRAGSAHCPLLPAAAAGQNGRVPADQEAVAVPPGAVHAHAAAQALCQPPLPAGWLQREEPQRGGCAIPASIRVSKLLFPATHPAQPAAATHPQCSQQAEPARPTCIPLPDAFPPGTGKAPKLCWVNVSGQTTPLNQSCLSLPAPWGAAPALTHLWVTSGSH